MNTHVEIDHSLTLPCGAIIRNRLMKSAMSEQLGDKNHNPKPGLETLYRTWGRGWIRPFDHRQHHDRPLCAWGARQCGAR